MSLAYKKIDNGESFTYIARFKNWQLMLIVFVPFFIGYLVPILNMATRVTAIIFGLGFAFLYGMSSIPAQWAFRKATKAGKQIIAEKKDGRYQYTVPKN